MYQTIHSDHEVRLDVHACTASSLVHCTARAAAPKGRCYALSAHVHTLIHGLMAPST